MATDSPTTQSKVRRKSRRERNPFGTHRRKLFVHDMEEGYHYHWFNDVQDDIQRASQAGYEFVTRKQAGEIGDPDVHNENTDLNDKCSRIVGRDRVDQPIRAFLMRINEDWYKEDMQALEEQNAKVDESVRRGSAPGTNPSQTQYVKGISYKA